MSFQGHLDGSPVTIAIEPTSLVADGRALPYVDIDAIEVDGHTIGLPMTDGRHAVVDQLGHRHDEFLLAFSDAWRRARRAALLQWTGDAPIDEYEAHGDPPATAVLFPDGLTVERLTGTPAMAPFSLVEGVERDGYRITLHLRAGLDNVVVDKLGKRTDEFVLDLDKARNDLAAATVAAYAALAPDLAGFTAPDGWAVSQTDAGGYWAALRAAVAGGERAAEIDHLAALAGDALRLGIKIQRDGAAMPFALAPVNGKVAVEGAAEGEARATFVFATDDIDRLNAVLLLTSFRREAISLPDDQLGRWALAVRSLDIVRWARRALVARVVHDDTWADKVTGALA